MPNLITMLRDPMLRDRVGAALRLDRASGVRWSVFHTDDWAELERVALNGSPHAAVVDPFAFGSLAEAEITAFLRAFPWTPVLAYADFRSRQTRDALRVVGLGLNHVILRDEEDSPTKLRDHLTDSIAESGFKVALASVREFTPAEVDHTLDLLLREACRPLTPVDVGRGMRCHPKTVRSRLKAYGLPPTAKLIVWLRLLGAAHLLGDETRTVANVANSLRFPSSSAMRIQFQRYLGLSPSQVRRRGGLYPALVAFRAACGLGEPRPEPAGDPSGRACTPPIVRNRRSGEVNFSALSSETDRRRRTAAADRG